MDNPFSWDYMTTAPGPNEVWGPFSIVYVIVFVALFVASLAIAAGWARTWFDNVVLYRMSRHWANWGLGLSIVALFFFIVRWLQINPFTFGERIWMYLSVLGLIGLILYAVHDYRKNYARLAEEHESRQVKERYLRQQPTRGRHGSVTIPAPPPKPVRRRK